MDNVDVKIYVAQFKTFFSQNPEEFRNLIGQATAEDFYNELERIAFKNYENGNEIPLTQSQLIDLIVDLNKTTSKKITKVVLSPYAEFKFGKIYLN